MKVGMRKYIFLALLLATPLAANQFIFVPGNRANREMLQELRDKHGQIQAVSGVRGLAMDNVNENIVALQEVIAVAQSRLPPQDEAGAILSGLALLADVNGLRTRKLQMVSLVEDGARVKEKTDSAQRISLELEGDFLGFYAYLQAIEARDCIVRVHSLKLVSLRDKGMVGQVSAFLDLAIFFRREADS